MKKLALVVAIAALTSASAFAVTGTFDQAGANAAAGSLAVAGPGNSSAVNNAQAFQTALAQTTATSVTTPGLSTINHVEGETAAVGGSIASTVTSGNALGVAGGTGHSGGNTGGFAADSTIGADGFPIAGLTAGTAVSRNTNTSVSAGAFGGFGSATQTSGNFSEFVGDANAANNAAGTNPAVLVTAPTSSTSIVGTNTASGTAANGALANFGFAGALGAATSGNVAAVTP